MKKQRFISIVLLPLRSCWSTLAVVVNYRTVVTTKNNNNRRDCWRFYCYLFIWFVTIQTCLCLDNSSSDKNSNYTNNKNTYHAHHYHPSNHHHHNIINDVESALAQEGCTNAKDATFVAPRVVACQGSWSGHISNCSHLCNNDFTLCTWQDDGHLKEIRWATATQLDGCYAYNAAQDGNKCIPCKSDVGSDDLAGIGKHCPHTNFGQSACLEQGRIDASCCLETLNNRACGYIPNVINGVLCCRRNNVVNDGPYQFTETIVSPPVQLAHFVGERVTLKCPLASTKPSEEVVWLKDEHLLPHVHTFTWTLPFARVSDSGLYACRAGPSNSIAVAHLNFTIIPVQNNACADGTSEGFHEAHNVAACAGSWKGHIKRADRQLCGRGWRVCVPKDRPFLQQIDVTYITDFGGCFSYNAAHMKHKCRRCQNKYSMASLGRDCPVNEKFVYNAKRPQRHACYENRIMQIYTKKFVQQNGGGGCLYRKDHQITGVLCCRKPKRKKQHHLLPSSDMQPLMDDKLICYPDCRNGGTCLNGQCLCPKGYFGHACQHGGCNPRCLNGGLCLYGFCKCDFPFHGKICQYNLRTPAVTLSENATGDESDHNQLSETL